MPLTLVAGPHRRDTSEDRRAAALARAEVGCAVSAWLRGDLPSDKLPNHDDWAESLSREATALGFDATWWAREHLLVARAARAAGAPPARRRSAAAASP